MTELHERDTYVVRERDSGSGAWIFGIIVAALAALGVWYFVSTEPTATVPAEQPAASSTMETAPAAPAVPETTAPSTVTEEPAAPAAAPAQDAAPAPANN